jgi:hypothetical protein
MIQAGSVVIRANDIGLVPILRGRHRGGTIGRRGGFNNEISRRAMLAGVPAVAVMAVPGTAHAAAGLATAVPNHLDAQGVKGLAEALERLDKLPTDFARQVLTAITKTLECSMDAHAHNAELVALGPQLDEALPESWQREEAEPRNEEEIDQAADKLYTLIDKVLSYKPLTREGLKLQCKAIVIDGPIDWDEGIAKFVTNFVLYSGTSCTRGPSCVWCSRREEKNHENDTYVGMRDRPKHLGGRGSTKPE